MLTNILFIKKETRSSPANIICAKRLPLSSSQSHSPFLSPIGVNFPCTPLEQGQLSPAQPRLSTALCSLPLLRREEAHLRASI